MGRFLRVQGIVERGQHALCKTCKGCREVSAPPCQPSNNIVREVLGETEIAPESQMTGINDAVWSIMFRCRHSSACQIGHRGTDVTKERQRAYSSH